MKKFLASLVLSSVVASPAFAAATTVPVRAVVMIKVQSNQGPIIATGTIFPGVSTVEIPSNNNWITNQCLAALNNLWQANTPSDSSTGVFITGENSIVNGAVVFTSIQSCQLER